MKAERDESTRLSGADRLCLVLEPRQREGGWQMPKNGNVSGGGEIKRP